MLLYSRDFVQCFFLRDPQALSSSETKEWYDRCMLKNAKDKLLGEGAYFRSGIDPNEHSIKE